ncbi:hypothetical protein PIIN_06865 [Serendipita indica DSM 11827]|uniref:Uncharacterized protein n=1 Tax=Serendipita indica (strain DSM 11827) TaxID=1109443 RepID=G4TNN6_SERID|nr:hypothetical protein PIIN_06865 [Serendipita indica DSM 11827]
MTLPFERTLKGGIRELSILAYVILLQLIVHNAVFFLLLSCSVVVYLPLVAPWSAILAVIPPTIFIVIHLVLFWEYLMANPLAEESALYRWAGLGLLRYTSPTLRLYRYMQSIGIIRYRLSALPPEIWERILTMALKSPAILGCIYNPPEDILSIIKHQMFQFYDDSTFAIRFQLNLAYDFYTGRDEEHPYGTYRRHCTRLSLVCSMWADIVRRQQRLWSCGKYGDGVYPLTQRLDFIIDNRSCTWLEDLLRRRHDTKSHPHQWDNLRVLALYQKIRTNPTDTSSHLSLISESLPSLFPKLRSLSYVTEYGTLNHITPFPNLYCLHLRLRSIKYVNDVRFERLRILTLECVELDLRGWQCPQLEHCAFLVRDGENREPSLVFPPGGHIYTPSRILSLIISGQQITLSSEFWRTYSSLVHLAVSSSSLMGSADSPPSSHPFSHLSILNIMFSDHTAVPFLSLLDSQHSLKSISLPTPHPTCWGPYIEEWIAFYRKACRLGIVKPPSPRGNHRFGWGNQKLSLWLPTSQPEAKWPPEPRLVETWATRLVSSCKAHLEHGLPNTITHESIHGYIMIGALSGLGSLGFIALNKAYRWNTDVLSEVIWWQIAVIFIASFTRIGVLMWRSRRNRRRQSRVPNLVR